MLVERHYGYKVVRQSGSHLRLMTTEAGEHRVAVPAGGPLRVGTLAAILAEVATHHAVSRAALEQRLWVASRRRRSLGRPPAG